MGASENNEEMRYDEIGKACKNIQLHLTIQLKSAVWLQPCPQSTVEEKADV